MFVLLFLLFTWSDVCHSQVLYNPLMAARYMVRPPVRRSAMETLEMMRLPVTRYFPQVDTVLPYQEPSYLSGYQQFNLPSQYAEDYVQQVSDEEGDYGNYDFDPRAPPAYAPRQYAEEVYAQEEEPSGDPFWMMEPKEELKKRDSEVTNSTTPSPQQVQVTGVPSAPEKKDVKSLVVPDQVAARDEDAGQKEEPLFRPLQNSQRAMWNGVRVKNTQQKNPIPLLKKMIQSGQQRKRSSDPLIEELTSLKRKI